VHSLEKDLPELPNFYQFPRHVWKKPRTSNAMERWFVEIRRRTRRMAVFTNV
jgi:transposase-like protein